jgi:hypothetical protein
VLFRSEKRGKSLNGGHQNGVLQSGLEMLKQLILYQHNFLVQDKICNTDLI